MSVSFYANLGEFKGFDVECECGAYYSDVHKSGLFTSSLDAEAVILTLEVGATSVCGSDHCQFALSTTRYENDDLPRLNVTNSNSRGIFDSLGLITEGAKFEDYSYGSMDSENFYARVLTAIGVSLESVERPTYTVGGDGHATMVVCGVPAGYVQDKLHQLLDVAESARKRDLDVVWG